jgi:hypothetical protein
MMQCRLRRPRMEARIGEQADTMDVMDVMDVTRVYR